MGLVLNKMRINKMNMTKVGVLGFAKQKNEDD